MKFSDYPAGWTYEGGNTRRKGRPMSDEQKDAFRKKIAVYRYYAMWYGVGMLFFALCHLLRKHYLSANMFLVLGVTVLWAREKAKELLK